MINQSPIAELWKARNNILFREGEDFQDSIAFFSSDTTSFKKQKERAARAAAAHNATSQFSIESLESGVVADLLVALKAYDEWMKFDGDAFIEHEMFLKAERLTKAALTKAAGVATNE